MMDSQTNQAFATIKSASTSDSSGSDIVLSTAESHHSTSSSSEDEEERFSSAASDVEEPLIIPTSAPPVTYSASKEPASGAGSIHTKTEHPSFQQLDAKLANALSELENSIPGLNATISSLPENDRPGPKPVKRFLLEPVVPVNPTVPSCQPDDSAYTKLDHELENAVFELESKLHAPSKQEEEAPSFENIPPVDEKDASSDSASSVEKDPVSMSEKEPLIEPVIRPVTAPPPTFSPETTLPTAVPVEAPSATSPAGEETRNESKRAASDQTEKRRVRKAYKRRSNPSGVPSKTEEEERLLAEVKERLRRKKKYVEVVPDQEMVEELESTEQSDVEMLRQPVVQKEAAVRSPDSGVTDQLVQDEQSDSSSSSSSSSSPSSLSSSSKKKSVTAKETAELEQVESTDSAEDGEEVFSEHFTHIKSAPLQQEPTAEMTPHRKPRSFRCDLTSTTSDDEVISIEGPGIIRASMKDSVELLRSKHSGSKNSLAMSHRRAHKKKGLDKFCCCS